MHPQRNLVEAARQIVKEQTNMGAVARIGINAINSRYKSTAGLNTPEDRLRNAAASARAASAPLIGDADDDGIHDQTRLDRFEKAIERIRSLEIDPAEKERRNRSVGNRIDKLLKVNRSNDAT